MTEWWTYRPSDFLMFAPATYWRLFELHNAAWWPAQPLLIAAALAWLARTVRTESGAPRLGAAGLALAWAFAGTAFVLGRYARINWGASALATLPLIAALVLGLLATQADLHTTADRARRRIGSLLVAWAAVAHPLLGWTSGRPLAQAEVVGLAPDPTAIATLGLLLTAGAASIASRRLLQAAWIATTGWCAISAATLWTMGAVEAIVPAAALVVALLASRRANASDRRPARTPARPGRPRRSG